jgi:hypothetical protein
MKMHEHLTRRFEFLVALWALGLSGPATAASPFDDARAVWRMGSAQDAAGECGPLSVEGHVALGVALTGIEREASLRHGGDGRVARFQGGYIRAPGGADRPLALEGQEMTFA